MLLVAILVLCTQVPAWLFLVRVLRSARDEQARRATWERATEARLAGQDRQRGHLGRAVAAIDPQGIKPTANLPRPRDEALAEAQRRRAAALEPGQPQRSAAALDAHLTEMAAGPQPPREDIDSDRAGFPPVHLDDKRALSAELAALRLDDALGLNDTEERARLRREAEAEVDARDRARAQADSPPLTKPRESRPHAVAREEAPPSDAMVITTFAATFEGTGHRESDERTHLYSREPPGLTPRPPDDRVTPTDVSPVLPRAIQGLRVNGDAAPLEGGA